MSSPFCTLWQNQVKEFSSHLHGHQSKTLALFVFGAIFAKRIAIPPVTEALLAESEVKASSIERRMERFVSNERIDPKHPQEEEALLIISDLPPADPPTETPRSLRVFGQPSHLCLTTADACH